VSEAPRRYDSGVSAGLTPAARERGEATMNLTQAPIFVQSVIQAPDIDLLDHLSNIPTWAAIILALIAWFRPQIQAAIQARLGIGQKRTAHQLDLETAKLDAELQDDVALWSSMVHLQTQSIEQNKKLLDVIIKSLDGELKRIAQLVKEELSEIERRWLAVTKELTDTRNEISREIAQTRNEMRIMKVELVRMSDGYQRLEQSIAVLMSAHKGNE
jgi:hypothetical protein